MEKEIVDLKEQIFKMEEAEREKQTILRISLILQISQCIYDFKEQIWTIIFSQNDKEKMQKSIGRDNLKVLLTTKLFDDELSESQIKIKNNIVKNIKKHFNFKHFFNTLNMITEEQNYLSHPNVKETYDVLHEIFLNHCNKIWKGNEEENKFFTKYIFDTLDHA